MTIVGSKANGFTGRFACAELKRRQRNFVALLRPSSDISWMDFHQHHWNLHPADRWIQNCSQGWHHAQRLLPRSLVLQKSTAPRVTAT